MYTRKRGGWNPISHDKHHWVGRVAGCDSWAWVSYIFMHSNLTWMEDVVPKPLSECSGILEGLQELCLVNWSWPTNLKWAVVDQLSFVMCQHLSCEIVAKAPPISRVCWKDREPGLGRTRLYTHYSTCLYDDPLPNVFVLFVVWWWPLTKSVVSCFNTLVSQFMQAWHGAWSCFTHSLKLCVINLMFNTCRRKTSQEQTENGFIPNMCSWHCVFGGKLCENFPWPHVK